MGETLARLTAARELHEGLSEAAMQAGAHEAGDSDRVAKELKRQNEEVKGSGQGNKELGRFPEFEAPHLVLASPAGIEASTAGSTHIASQAHNALTSGGHTSVGAGKSVLVSAREAVRMAAFEKGMRLIAAAGDIDLQALKDGINVLAKLEIRQEANRITITAKEEVLINGGTSFTRWNAQGIVSGTNGIWRAHAASHSMVGPDNLPVPPTALASATLYQAQYVIVSEEDGTPLAFHPYELRVAGGAVRRAHTNDKGETSTVYTPDPRNVDLKALKNKKPDPEPWHLAGGGSGAIPADYLDDEPSGET